jgi:hypothetical protein
MPGGEDKSVTPTLRKMEDPLKQLTKTVRYHWSFQLVLRTRMTVRREALSCKGENGLGARRGSISVGVRRTKYKHGGNFDDSSARFHW